MNAENANLEAELRNVRGLTSGSENGDVLASGERPDSQSGRENNRVAFALGGLAGNNAHGAGFLQAALDSGVKPDMISCTSGQILWVSRYLKAAKAKPDVKPDVLLDQLREDIKTTAPFPSKDVDLAYIGMFGKPEVMRLAWQEAAFDLVVNSIRSLQKIVSDPRHAFFTREMLRILPARQLVMELDDEFFEDIANTLDNKPSKSTKPSESPIGIVFNSYDPVAGIEYIHRNGAAVEFSHNRCESQIRGERSKYTPITAKGVRDALWIVQYGFDDNQVIDGAYHRQIILDELMPATHVFVARPIKYQWVGPLPKSWPDLEDMKTEMAFDGSYRCEVDKIEIINKLISDKAFGEETCGKYRHVNLHEIELEKPRSFFEYIFEDEDVFIQARKQANKIFDKFP